MQSCRFYLATLGCKVNQYESHSLREAWRAQGMVETTSPEDAHCILVNSCAVTAKAVADVRHTIRRLHRLAPDAAIFVTGCAAEVEAKALAALEGVVEVIPQAQKSGLLHRLPLAQHEQGKGVAKQGTHAAVSPPAEHASESAAELFPEAHAAPQTRASAPAPAAEHEAYPEFQVQGYDRSRAVVKVQDGCSHRCTYCIVPLTRGRSLSRPAGEVLAEMRRLLDAGFREIGISGVNLRQYAVKDDARFDFWDLLGAIEKEFAPEWAGQARLRISSLEPGQLGPKALEALGTSRLVAPHLHISLQSGSPAVLRRMGRGHYDPAPVTDFVRELGQAWPLLGLGADILTGFPGESEAEHQETLDLCHALPFTYAHVFPYSKRPGTAAALMGGQVAAEVKKARASALRGLVAAKKQAFLQHLLHVPVHHVVAEVAGLPGEQAGEAPTAASSLRVVSGGVSLPSSSGGVPTGAENVRSRRSRITGVNAQYAECCFVEGTHLPGGNSLVAARPVGVAGEVLLVALL